uniref:Methionyl/Valyl/Leucyl/Isoleucyl-tRNA synthetase anticodon-binding domain-containing protein n=1 Tax=Panagrolaimus davidi TaxID=227884 RepID=A0A914P501_9BILA
MDKWILSFTNSLVKFVHNEMKYYRLYTVVGPLMKYFDALTNCYIRLNRPRLKGDSVKSKEDHEAALSTLGHVLVIITQLMTPFTPFFCEYLWKTMKIFTTHADESVHFSMLPVAEEQYIDADVERQVDAMRSVIDIVRVLRERKNLGVRYPLPEIVVVNRNQKFLDDVETLKYYILSECNVKTLTVSVDKEKYGVLLKPNIQFKELAARLKASQKDVVNYLKTKVSQDELAQLLDVGKLTIGENYVTTEEVSVVYTFDPAKLSGGNDEWEVQADHQSVIMLNIKCEDDLLKEGVTREIINRIQQLRKSGKLTHFQHATIHIIGLEANSLLETVVKEQEDAIKNQTNSTILIGNVSENDSVSCKETARIKDVSFDLCLLGEQK